MGDGKKAPWTPGPWRVDDEIHQNVVESDYHVIDGGAGFHGGPAEGFSAIGFMSVANARLIAAAPNLAEALEPFAHWANQQGGVVMVAVADCRRAAAALSLARGEKG